MTVGDAFCKPRELRSLETKGSFVGPWHSPNHLCSSVSFVGIETLFSFCYFKRITKAATLVLDPVLTVILHIQIRSPSNSIVVPVACYLHRFLHYLSKHIVCFCPVLHYIYVDFPPATLFLHKESPNVYRFHFVFTPFQLYSHEYR